MVRQFQEIDRYGELAEAPLPFIVPVGARHLPERLPRPLHLPESADEISAFTAWLEAEHGRVGLPAGYRIAKRLFDIVVSSLGLILLAPLMLLVALVIRLDSPGPALFTQERVGYRGRTFRVYKFRTMKHGSGVLTSGRSHKLAYDQRVTRVGRVLRKTSIDEFPQLLNVLRGQMSLVGPRPEIVEIVLTKYQPWQYRRFLVPQGITGWWQVTGRGGKLLHEHTADDLHYIEHASLGFDLQIILMTIPAVLKRDGAF